MKKDFRYIKDLVGDIKKKNLKYVDYYVIKNFGIFIPVVGQCGYAIKKAHTHPAYSFIIYFDPKSSIYSWDIDVPSENYLVELFPYDFSHEEKIQENFNRYIAVFISKDTYESIFNSVKENISNKPFAFYINKNIMIHINNFIKEYNQSFIFKEQILKCTSDIITYELIRGLDNVKSYEVIDLKNYEVEKAVNYIHQNYYNKISIADLSAICAISESGLNKAFKKELNMSPLEYIIKIRVEKSKKLIQSKSHTLTETALKCGFNSLSHFSYCFKKSMKISPRDYFNLYK